MKNLRKIFICLFLLSPIFLFFIFFTPRLKIYNKKDIEQTIFYHNGIRKIQIKNISNNQKQIIFRNQKGEEIAIGILKDNKPFAGSFIKIDLTNKRIYIQLFIKGEEEFCKDISDKFSIKNFEINKNPIGMKYYIIGN